MLVEEKMEEIISLCKRRGFIYPGSEIYGGLKGTYDYGPLGIELKNNLKHAWWSSMLYEREDIEGIDTTILTHPLTLRFSGHEETFSDPLVDCKDCKSRWRADLIKRGCPKCGSKNFTEARNFNLMLKTGYGPVESAENFVYLRPETAQGIFINFKNVLDTTSRKLPFGIAQIGKSFRNEITPRNFIFRMREFEQMELEYFVQPGEDATWHKYWIEKRVEWWLEQGLSKDKLKLYEQQPSELAHYAKATTDILYEFPHGVEELEGVANRTDYDLGTHSKNQSELNLKSQVIPNNSSNAALTIKDDEKDVVPYVIEPSAGVDRGVLALLCEGYVKEILSNGQSRNLLKLKKHLAPVKIAIIPLAKNNSEIIELTERVALEARKKKIGRIKIENSGNIGKNYRRHDEIGTPYCLTIDFETLRTGQLTVRDRDTTAQQVISIDNVKNFITENF